jgi:uncharacterized protein (TIGR04222 family)
MLMAQMNPLDLPGPAFLALYIILLVCALVVALLFRRWLVAIGEGRRRPRVSLDPYEAAFLTGGSKAVIDTAIAMLVQRQALKASSATRSLTRREPLPRGAHPIEQAVYQAVASTLTPVAKVRAAARWSVEQTADRLKEMGLVLSDARWWVARSIPALIIAAVLLLGVAKIFVGLSRNRPVSFLVILSLLTAVIALAFFLSRPRATPLGEQALLQLRIDNVALQSTARSRPQALTPGDIAFAIGLFGVASLPFADHSWTELKQTLSPPPPSISSSSSSGSSCGSSSSCSSSSCGSSCGGGGGCGGCGGG